jgi:hypothetical protein
MSDLTDGLRIFPTKLNISIVIMECVFSFKYYMRLAAALDGGGWEGGPGVWIIQPSLDHLCVSSRSGEFVVYPQKPPGLNMALPLHASFLLEKCPKRPKNSSKSKSSTIFYARALFTLTYPERRHLFVILWRHVQSMCHHYSNLTGDSLIRRRFGGTKVILSQIKLQTRFDLRTTVWWF